MDYSKIMEEYGTPTYVFSIDDLENRIKYLRSIINNDVKLCYAMKANPFIISYLPEGIDRIEVCSPGEYEICKKEHIYSSKLVISGVYKCEEQIDDVIKKQDEEIITIESESQYKLIKSLAKKHKRCVKVLIRLTSGNQFGVSEEELFKILEENSDNEFISIKGIEYFSGTQKHSLKKIEREFAYLDEIFSKVKSRFKIDLEELEYGTGFPIFYFEGDTFDEEEFLSGFNLLLTGFKGVKITLEVGRSIVAESGTYLTRVVDMKMNETGNYAIVDGGIHQLVYYGGSLAMKVPYYEIIPKRNDKKILKWMICGSLCSVNDILMKNIEIDNLQIGDLLVFKNTGAYSVTEGISLFLSRDLPKVLAIKNNKIIVLRGFVPTYPLNAKSKEV